MENLKKLFQNSLSKSKNNDIASDQSEDVSKLRNWYLDRYESLLIQRNILFLFVILSFGVMLVSVYIVGKIASSKSIQPFVVEIEDKTGITNLVNPMTRTELSSNQALSSYFIVKYIRSREGYDPLTYEADYNKTVKLMSSEKTYGEFWQYITSNTTNPISTYGTNNSTYLKFRSMQYLDDGKVQARFTVFENRGQRRVFPKIVTLTFEYNTFDYTEQEREVNPLGFQITSYKVDDEILS